MQGEEDSSPCNPLLVARRTFDFDSPCGVPQAWILGPLSRPSSGPADETPQGAGRGDGYHTIPRRELQSPKGSHTSARGGAPGTRAPACEPCKGGITSCVNRTRIVPGVDATGFGVRLGVGGNSAIAALPRLPCRPYRACVSGGRPFPGRCPGLSYSSPSGSWRPRRPARSRFARPAKKLNVSSTEASRLRWHRLRHEGMQGGL